MYSRNIRVFSKAYVASISLTGVVTTLDIFKWGWGEGVEGAIVDNFN